MARRSRADKRIDDVPLFDPAAGETVLEPEAEGAGYWVGAPSVLWDPARGRFLLTYRRRRPRGRDPDRGYVACIAESRDGLRFKTVWQVEKAAWSTTSMEKFCLTVAGERYRLYTSYVDPEDSRWRIDVLEADRPDKLVPSSAQKVFTAADVQRASGAAVEGVKDPYVLCAGGLWHMLISFAAGEARSPEEATRMHATADVYNTGLVTARTALATSVDGLEWRWEGEVMGCGPPDAWDAYQTRLGSLLYRPPAWIGFYDGSARVDENYEERTGLAVSLDLRRWERLTPGAPALVAPHGSGSLRYLDVTEHDGKLYYYYEYARPDGSHELRRNVVPL